MANKPAEARCPCGSAATYEHCCSRWHDGALRLLAPTAEALMRSRYSAHVFGLEAYLLDTWHPRTRPLGMAPPPQGLRWIGLAVRRHTPIDGEHATVEFVARSKVGGRAERMHVVSRFERVEGRWLYVEDEDAAA
jgi:SEC-C motif-containing protein